jgi:hypothetical protein
MRERETRPDGTSAGLKARTDGKAAGTDREPGNQLAFFWLKSKFMRAGHNGL